MYFGQDLVDDLDRRGELHAVEQMQRVFAHGEHHGMSAGFAVGGKDRCVGPQDRLGPQSQAQMSFLAAQAHHGLPRAVDVPALKAEGANERITLKVAVGLRDADAFHVFS